MAMRGGSERLVVGSNKLHGSIGESVPKDMCNHNIVIKCGSQEFIASRTLLCQYSKKFRQMAKGIKPNQEWEVNMTSVPQDVLRKLLKFIQMGDLKIFKDMPNGSLFSCLSLAHSMEMTEIETAIFSLLIKKSESHSTIAYLWDLSKKYGNDQAVKAIVRFTVDNMVDMIDKGFFKAITWEQLCHLISHFSRDHSLDELCVAAIQWLKMDPAKKMHLPLVARRLDWRRLSQDKICHLIFTEPLFRRMLKNAVNENLWSPPPFVLAVDVCSVGDMGPDLNPVSPALNIPRQGVIYLKLPFQLTKYKQSRIQSLCQDVGARRSRSLMEEDMLNSQMTTYSKAWQCNVPVKQLLPPNSSVNYLKPSIVNPAFLLLGATRNNSLAIQVYFVKTREWAVPLDITMQYRCDFECLYHQQNLFILGGDRGDGSTFQQCFAYNVYNYTLQEITQFRHPRSKAGVAISGNDMFVLGGLNEKHEAVSIALKMSLTDRFEMWKPIKPLKDKRASPGVAVDPIGKIIVIGGHSTCCEYYHQQGWIEMESLPIPYNHHGMHAVYCNQKVYAFRDYCPQEVCVFDMVKNDLKIMPTCGTYPDKIASICCFGTEIWVITPKGRFFIYCIDTTLWKKTPLKSTDMCEFFYAAIIEEDDVRTFENKPEIGARAAKNDQ